MPKIARAGTLQQEHVVLATLSAIALLFAPGLTTTVHSQAIPSGCIGRANPGVRISRPQLAQLIQLPHHASMDWVWQILGNDASGLSNPPKQPTMAPRIYCQMAPIATQEGRVLQRLALPMSWDPEHWIVVLSDRNQFAGIDFSFNHGYPQ